MAPGTHCFLPAAQTVRIISSPKPKLFIMGGHDIFTSVFAFRRLTQSRQREPPTTPHASHARQGCVEHAP